MTTPNTSASGGYLLPTTTAPFPGGVTFVQFIQMLLVGVSNIDGTLVRPKWQSNPPKKPDINVNWFAFGFTGFNPDTNPYEGLDSDGNFDFRRNTEFEIQVSVYGPDSMDLVQFIQDGLQISQNSEALLAASMGLINTSPGIHAPELVNERYFDRWDFSIFMRRQNQRTYPVLPFISASGIITTVFGNEQYVLDWTTESEEN